MVTVTIICLLDPPYNLGQLPACPVGWVKFAGLAIWLTGGVAFWIRFESPVTLSRMPTHHRQEINAGLLYNSDQNKNHFAVGNLL